MKPSILQRSKRRNGSIPQKSEKKAKKTCRRRRSKGDPAITEQQQLEGIHKTMKEILVMLRQINGQVYDSRFETCKDHPVFFHRTWPTSIRSKTRVNKGEAPKEIIRRVRLNPVKNPNQRSVRTKLNPNC